MRENQSELTAQPTPVRAPCAFKVWVVISAAKKIMTRQRCRQLFWGISICLEIPLLFVSV